MLNTLAAQISKLDGGTSKALTTLHEALDAVSSQAQVGWFPVSQPRNR